MRIVLDTSVGDGELETLSCARLPRSVLLLVASASFLLEYEDLLKRPEHRLVHDLSLQAIGEFLRELAAPDRAG